MRVLSAFFLSVILCSTGMATECTLANARYKQPDAPWWLTFKRVPQIAPANQTAAFYIEMPNSDVVLEGGVSVPRTTIAHPIASGYRSAPTIRSPPPAQ